MIIDVWSLINMLLQILWKNNKHDPRAGTNRATANASSNPNSKQLFHPLPRSDSSADSALCTVHDSANSALGCSSTPSPTPHCYSGASCCRAALVNGFPCATQEACYQAWKRSTLLPLDMAFLLFEVVFVAVGVSANLYKSARLGMLMEAGQTLAEAAEANTLAAWGVSPLRVVQLLRSSSFMRCFNALSLLHSAVVLLPLAVFLRQGKATYWLWRDPLWAACMLLRGVSALFVAHTTSLRAVLERHQLFLLHRPALGGLIHLMKVGFVLGLPYQVVASTGQAMAMYYTHLVPEQGARGVVPSVVGWAVARVVIGWGLDACLRMWWVQHLKLGRQDGQQAGVAPHALKKWEAGQDAAAVAEASRA